MGSRMHGPAGRRIRRVAEKALESVPAWFEEWEQALSRFRPGNELDRLNHSNGLPMAVSADPLGSIPGCHHRRKIHGRAGDPHRAGRPGAGGLRPLVRISAGSSRRSGLTLAMRSPGCPSPVPPLPGISPPAAWFFPTIRHLDLGGVAKGWAADQACGAFPNSDRPW